MHTLIEKYIQSNHFGKLIGMRFTILANGHVEYRLTVDDKLLATPHAAHGGAIAALIDGAMGVAALSAVCAENQVVSTVEYKVNFLSPALLNDELIATGKTELKGKRLVVVSCDVRCEQRNVTIAKALGTFNAYDAAKAGYGG
jgi:uncharacterized protein (TIGR00369 family)